MGERQNVFVQLIPEYGS